MISIKCEVAISSTRAARAQSTSDDPHRNVSPGCGIYTDGGARRRGEHITSPVLDESVDDVELKGEDMVDDVRARGGGLYRRECAKDVGCFC